MASKRFAKIFSSPHVQSMFVVGASSFFLYAITFNQLSAMTTIKNEIRNELSSLKNSQVQQKDKLSHQMTVLREEIIKYKVAAEKKEKVKGVTSQDIPVASSSAIKDDKQPREIIGIMQLKKSWSKIDVFAEAKASSTIVGQILPDKIYFLYEKKPGWLLIDYKLNEFGWVQSSLVDEM